MSAYSRWLLFLAALLFADVAWAQEQRPGWLGAELLSVTKEEADRLGWEAPRGAKVARPADGSPAAVAGLERDDIIAALDGVNVANVSGLYAAVTAKGPGTQVKLRVLRAGKERTVTATLATRPDGLATAAPSPLQLMLDPGGHMAVVVGVAFTPDGKQLVSASNDKTLRVWDVESGRTIRTIRGEMAPGSWGANYAMALSPDGRWLATGGYFHGFDPAIAGAVRLYDFASGRLEALLKGHDNVVHSLAFSPDSKRLISGSGDRTAIVWDVSTRRPTRRLYGHSGTIKAIAFTSDGDRAVTGGDDETLRLWNIADGKPIAEMTQHKPAGSISSVAVSPAEQLIASGSEDGRVVLWDGQTGALLRQIIHPERFVAAVPSLSFSADGQWLLFSSFARGCVIN
jgi:WD40 repeat protein